MRCYVYRSKTKSDTYLYLPEAEGFPAVPDSLMQVFGRPELALEIELGPARSLATEDARLVLRNLLHRGFHLQMPPPESGSRPAH